MKSKEELEHIDTIKQEIQLISNWCGIRIGYITMLVVLLVESIIQMIYHEPVTAFIILLMGVIAPIPVGVWIKQRVGEEKSSLKMTKRRYHYAYNKYKTYQIVNIFLLLLIILWKLSNNNSAIQNIRMDVFPILVIVCGLVGYIGGGIYYRFLIPQRLKNNK